MLISCKFDLLHFPVITPISFFLFKFMTITVLGHTSQFVFPADDILVSCGVSGNWTSLDGRDWSGDVGSKFISSVESTNTNTAYKPLDLIPKNDAVPYNSVRIFHSELTYSFNVKSGLKLIRFYFNPTSAHKLNSSKAFFSVKVGSFTLISNFTPFPSSDPFAKEFCINIEENQALNITFTPNESNDAYGFINGIEIVSIPTNLYHTGSGYMGVQYIGGHDRFVLRNNTALEMIHRLNVGGRSILPVNDSGMFRNWTEDSSFVLNLDSTHTNRTTGINFTTIHSYAAPIQVYQTARFTGKRMNLTWKLPVDAGFLYLVRLHFCELQQGIKRGDREFQIFIANKMAETSADIISWTNGSRIPVFRDYVVDMSFPNGTSTKRNYLFVALQPKGKSNPILNGLELFKINNTDGNLGEHNPEASIALPVKQAQKSEHKRTVTIVISVATTAVIMVLLLAAFAIFWHCKTARFSEESMKPLSNVICRRFTAEEIRNATNDFDRALVIGNGGFGRVFKGYIDAEKTPVAIKALKPTSSQGSQEFWTEIEMLSKLRHRHLVSLIGYCNDEHMMILVYDHMAHGTLRDHLYDTQNPPLSWKHRLEICIGAARGIKFLHTGAEHCIIHRDIKSSNVLLDENWVPKVSDFGLSRLGPTSISRSHVTTEVKGTFGYLDPEYYYTHHLSVKSDVFSFGVLLFEVLCARPAVDLKVEEEHHSLVLWAKQHIKQGTLDQIIDPNLTGEISPESLKVYARIAVKCLHNHKKERPTMSNVLKKLELALKLQESADAAAEEGIIESGSEKEEISLSGSRNNYNSGCLVHSCPTFWKKNLSPRENLRFFSDRGRGNNKMATKRLPFRGLRGLFYALFAYKSLSREKWQSSDSCSGSSSCELDFTSEKMLIEIMAHQEES